MFKIGDFSKFSRVSVKMLRHYDQLDLLKPARIDEWTGYRYYSAAQLPRLNRILALRDLGFSLEQIASFLDDRTSIEQLRGMLTLKQAELEQQLHEEQERLKRVEARLEQIEREGQPHDYEVVVRRIPPQRAATLRQVIPDEEAIPAMFEEVERHVARHSARAEAPPVLISHDDEYREQDLDVEVAIPVDGDLPGTTRIKVGDLPGWETMACVVHAGSYETIGAANEALLAWIEANGWEFAGPIRTVYLRFSAAGLDVPLPAAYLAGDEDEFVTELQVPIVSGPRGS